MRAVGPELRALVARVLAEEPWPCCAAYVEPNPPGTDDLFDEAIERGLILSVPCASCREEHGKTTQLGRIALRLPQEQGVGA